MNRIKELRLSLGKTQTELASIIGLNQTAIGKYERGELEPGLETLKKLSNIFECSIDYIVGNTDDLGVISIKNDLSQQKKPALPSDAQELLTLFDTLSPMHRLQVLEYTRYFVERELATKKQNKHRGEY